MVGVPWLNIRNERCGIAEVACHYCSWSCLTYLERIGMLGEYIPSLHIVTCSCFLSIPWYCTTPDIDGRVCEGFDMMTTPNEKCRVW